MPGANRFSTWFGGELQPWDVYGDGPVPFIDLLYFRAVLRELDALCPEAGVHVVATNAFRGPLPVQGPDVVVLCVAEEFAVPPHYAHDVRLVVKTMGGKHRRPYVAPWPPRRWPALPLAAAQELVVQGRRAPYVAASTARTVRTRRPAPVLDVPIGIRAFEALEPVPFAERRYDVAFAGSLVNEAREHERRWRSQKLRARQAFLREVERLQADRPQLSVWLRVVATHWDGTSVTRSYSEALSQSRLVLCPRGSSVDTHRYFEAMRAGCVPLYEMLPRRDYYRDSPGVHVRDWSQLQRVVDELLADPPALLERHRAALAAYERWAAPDAVARRIAAALG